MEIIGIIFVVYVFRFFALLLKNASAAFSSRMAARARKEQNAARECERAAKAKQKADAAQEREEARERKAQAAMEQAEADIPFLKERISNLYALLDIAEGEYHATTNAQKQARFLRQINSLTAQIHAAETKLTKARAILSR